jgi:2',3'-cyclic-nucleotide 2'-phosphodiesterase (5'-nucleotidase family)
MHAEIFWGAHGPVYRQAGGYGRIAALVQQARAEQPGGVLLLDNGDTLHGTYPAGQTQGQALVPLLTHLQPDAMTAHWEFAYGPQTFKQRAAELPYPVLAMKVKSKDKNEPFFPAYRVVEVGGLRVGIAGVASNIVDKTMPPSFSEGLRFSLGREDLPGVIETLRSREGVHLVVLLSHLGLPQDLQLLADIPGVDICLSGHTHNRLYRPIRQGQTIVMQSGSHGAFLGRLEVEVSDGKVIDFDHRLIEVAQSIPPDAEMEGLVQQVLQPFRAELSEEVGETRQALDRGLNLETSMDNLLLSALLEETGAQVAFSNGWRYGAPIPPGPVTMNDLYNIIPMNPPVSTVQITGEEMTAMLEENLEHTFARDPYRQMGGYVKRAMGLKVTFKVENPSGQRIQQVFVGEEEVQPSRVYDAAFVTEQGVPEKYGHNRQKQAAHAIPALRKYVERHSPLEIGLLGSFVLV